MRYKILTISESELLKALEFEYKSGYEPIHWLEKVNPNSSSDFNGWKILFAKRK